jgi:hypothetical protein
VPNKWVHGANSASSPGWWDTVGSPARPATCHQARRDLLQEAEAAAAVEAAAVEMEVEVEAVEAEAVEMEVVEAVVVEVEVEVEMVEVVEVEVVVEEETALTSSLLAITHASSRPPGTRSASPLCPPTSYVLPSNHVCLRKLRWISLIDL